MEWIPILCSISLNFGTGESEGRCGSSYTGSVVIRYRREPILSQTKYSSAPFAQLRQFVQSKSGLHLYACTRVGPSTPKGAVALVVEQYKVHRVGDQKAPLKLLSVLEVQSLADMEKDCDSTPTAKKEVEKEKKKKLPKKKSVEKESSSEGVEEQGDVTGSKIVLFEGGETLPEGCEVELTVGFTGTVQTSEVGGIYSPLENSSVLLTHFEVFLSRLAFPCPDHPEYRLLWQLKQLQVPERFSTVLHNTSSVSEKALDGAVQHSFPIIGPLPAYLLCFAVIVGDTIRCEEFLSVHSFLTGGMAEESVGEIPLRVVALPNRHVETETLHRIAGLATRVLPLLERFFQCPFPSLLTDSLTIALLPTMPYISGMEHHGCIFLNESIFSKANSNAPPLAEQDQLVIHEVLHHWAGNTLGIPFSVKEGMCLLLEKVFESEVHGKPVKKVKNQNQTSSFETVEGGKEFTGHTYQHALLALENVLADIGMSSFESRTQQLYHDVLDAWLRQVEEEGGLESMAVNPSSFSRKSLSTPYVDTETFLKYMTGSDSA